MRAPRAESPWFRWKLRDFQGDSRYGEPRLVGLTPSTQLAQFAREHNLVRSVCRTAVCWDNAHHESFWATLEVDFYGRYLWPTKAAAKPAVGLDRTSDNRRRRHSAGSARSTSKTDSLRWHKPPDPVSTKRGQAQWIAKTIYNRRITATLSASPPTPAGRGKTKRAQSDSRRAAIYVRISLDSTGEVLV